jgi:hypothetical protein
MVGLAKRGSSSKGDTVKKGISLKLEVTTTVSLVVAVVMARIIPDSKKM